jgi:hypothetical protein
MRWWAHAYSMDAWCGARGSDAVQHVRGLWPECLPGFTRCTVIACVPAVARIEGASVAIALSPLCPQTVGRSVRDI